VYQASRHFIIHYSAKICRIFNSDFVNFLLISVNYTSDIQLISWYPVYRFPVSCYPLVNTYEYVLITIIIGAQWIMLDIYWLLRNIQRISLFSKWVRVKLTRLNQKLTHSKASAWSVCGLNERISLEVFKREQFDRTDFSCTIPSKNETPVLGNAKPVLGVKSKRGRYVLW